MRAYCTSGLCPPGTNNTCTRSETGPENNSNPSDCPTGSYVCKITTGQGGDAAGNSGYPKDNVYHYCQALYFGGKVNKTVSYIGNIPSGFDVSVVVHYGQCVYFAGAVTPGQPIANCENNYSNLQICLTPKRRRELEAEAAASSSKKGTALRTWFN
jgi:hypothetical protein